MKVTVFGWHCEGVVSNEEAIKHCIRDGGADCCGYLVHGTKGFECRFNNGLGLNFETMTAKRRGCEELIAFSPFGMEPHTEVEINLLGDGDEI